MGPSIQFRMPPGWFFKFPPNNQPPALPPPTEARTFAALFPIRADIYNGALDYKVPITIGLLYASTVLIWNRINVSRDHKPYGFSQTKPFKAFVIAHNLFLAVFSALTFFGMLRALAHTWPGREHHLFGKFWPGLRTEHGIAGAADALCKMHGPRGFGSFVAYNPDSDVWEVKNKLIQMTGGLPDSTDAGRLWNEGLAFWGWWFYLSKFYEVFDTFILLAKGKRSSTLQTYHHTGAMMCMWAGIRFMSPPIWMFCFLNSGIHTMMYIYYMLSALSIRVPQRIKRTLTTMQISQFLIGITFAALHLFVTYRVPISRTETITKSVEAIASSMVAGVSSAAATATSSGIAAWLKQAALRAAGEEGLAENVLGRTAQAPLAGSSPYESGSDTRSGSGPSKYTSSWETVPCIDTSGQAFAIWLNLAYLAPLTVLFVRFFIKSYSRRYAASRKDPNRKPKITKSIQDAAHGVDREVDSVGKAAEKRAGNIAKEIEHNGKAINGKTHGADTPRSRRVSDKIEKTFERFEKGETPIEKVNRTIKETLSKKASLGHNELRSMFEDVNTNSAQSDPTNQDQGGGRPLSDAFSTPTTYADDAMEKLEDAAEASVRKAKEAVGMGSENAQSSKESIAEEDNLVNGSSPKEAQTPKKDELHESWADVAKDTDQHKEEQQQATSGAEKGDSSSAQGLEAPAEEKRSASPAQARSPSPKKSQIPRRAKETSRSRSPVKEAKPEKKSSIPRPTSQGPTKALNGTKPPTTPTLPHTSSPDSQKEKSPRSPRKLERRGKTATPSGPEAQPSDQDAGKLTPLFAHLARLPQSLGDRDVLGESEVPSESEPLAPSKDEGLLTPAQFAHAARLRPGFGGVPKSDSLSNGDVPSESEPLAPSKDEGLLTPAQFARAASLGRVVNYNFLPVTSESEPQDEKHTNDDSKQESSPSTSTSVCPEEESLDGGDKLRFRHSSTDEVKGGSAVREEGVSYAEAAKTEEEEEDMETSGISID